MKRALTVLVLLLWLPAAAASAPISAEEYHDRLGEAFALVTEAEMVARDGDEAAAQRKIQAAADLLAGVDQVQAGAGVVEADLTDLRNALRTAVADPDWRPRAREMLLAHVHAAYELTVAKPVEAPGARAALNRALSKAARQTLLQRLRQWYSERFFRTPEYTGVGEVPRGAYWAGGIIGALALAWAGFFLYRSLTGHGAGKEGVWRGGADAAPARPPTPAELLQAAREAAGRSEYLSAVRLAHLGVLQHLDGLGIIRYQASQTNREHEVQLSRRRPDLVPPLHSLHDLLEGCLYGGRPARAEEYQRAESLVMQIWREGDAVSESAERTPGRSS